jgi:hypothetical protein
MNNMELLINLKEQNSWIQDRFPKKDLITLDELMSDYEDLIGEVEHLQEEIEDFKQDRDENFQRVSISSQVGIDDNYFI